jgi:putative methionine-R-sulfoxide reductase with GAF domain
MPHSPVYRKDAVEFITKKIRTLNSVVLLVVAVLLFVMVRFLYTFLDYVPARSVAALLAITAGLIILGIFMVRNTSRKAIDAIEEYSRKLSALLTTSKNIHEAVYSDVILNTIIDISMDFTGADAGSILLIEGETLLFKIVKGKESRKLTGFSFPKSAGIAGWVITNGEPLRIDDAKSDPRFYPTVDGITDYETSSVLCVPLKLSTGCIGVVELVNKKSGPFTPDDEEFLSYFSDQAAISIERARLSEDEKNYEIHLTNILIDAMEHRPEKEGHSKRVAQYTILMARALNMPEAEQKQLYYASLLHDIGFLKIKQDVLSLEEFQKHPEIAYEMLHPINFYTNIAPLVLHHHERYDGAGYPSGLRGKSIPIASRMISIAEAFDAMVSGNSYKKLGTVIFQNVERSAMGFEAAKQELRDNAGTQFDPELVELFLSNIGEEYAEIK